MDLGVNIKHLGHATFRIESGEVIYIDPFNLKVDDKADVILITHSHFDHCSIKDIKRLVKNGTEIFVTPDCQSKLNHFDKVKVNLVHPNKSYSLGSLKIDTVPAYNLNKSFHPRANDWVGYIITVNTKRIYHAGDTDFIPEMKTLKDIDIALLPIGGMYTMDVDEAAAAANSFKPKVVIPMHYGAIEGTSADPNKFASQLDKSIKFVIL
jgi:L-ascorbate metabolism protein UlaG (beta-lactamase superfamily)